VIFSGNIKTYAPSGSVGKENVDVINKYAHAFPGQAWKVT
jgi:hypothetical protein